MGVYLPNMEMPKYCGDCPMADSLSCQLMPGVPALWAEFTSAVREKRRHTNCPLIELPPHGRLIDADELAQRFNDAIERAEKDKTDYCNAFMYHGDLCTEWWCVNGMLEKAPTIVPAEGKEET